MPQSSLHIYTFFDHPPRCVRGLARTCRGKHGKLLISHVAFARDATQAAAHRAERRGEDGIEKDRRRVYGFPLPRMWCLGPNCGTTWILLLHTRIIYEHRLNTNYYNILNVCSLMNFPRRFRSTAMCPPRRCSSRRCATTTANRSSVGPATSWSNAARKKLR